MLSNIIWKNTGGPRALTGFVVIRFMASILEYFASDIQGLSLDQSLSVADSQSGTTIDIKIRAVHSIDSSTAVLVFYIPRTSNALDICLHLIQTRQKILESLSVKAIGGFFGDSAVGTPQTTYSNRIYFYTETDLRNGLKQIEESALANGLYITVRGPDYIERRMNLEKPLAFVSHDSRDKQTVARRIANGLSSRLCPVWYDEYSLKVGDSLRESIEKGIKEAKKCILILTPHFLGNPGWTKKEFNSIFTREMILNERIILPIWSGVTKRDVYEYSPSLADTVALPWPVVDAIPTDEFNRAVEKLISQLHTVIVRNA